MASAPTFSAILAGASCTLPLLFRGMGAVKSNGWGDILYDLPYPVAIVLPSGHVYAANPALELFLGYTTSELKSKHFREYTVINDRETDRAFFQELMGGSRTSYRLHKTWLTRVGREVSGTMTATSLKLSSPITHESEEIDNVAVAVIIPDAKKDIPNTALNMSWSQRSLALLDRVIEVIKILAAETSGPTFVAGLLLLILLFWLTFWGGLFDIIELVRGF